jgi:hypothetical protein
VAKLAVLASTQRLMAAFVKHRAQRYYPWQQAVGFGTLQVEQDELQTAVAHTAAVQHNNNNQSL